MQIMCTECQLHCAKVGKHFGKELFPPEEIRGTLCLSLWSSVSSQQLWAAVFQTVLTLGCSQKNTFCHNHSHKWVWITTTEDSADNTEDFSVVLFYSFRLYENTLFHEKQHILQSHKLLISCHHNPKKYGFRGLTWNSSATFHCTTSHTPLSTPSRKRKHMESSVSLQRNSEW